MTPPGDPLKFGFGDVVGRLFLRYAQSYPYLEAQIKAAIAEEAPHTIKPIWKRREKNGHELRGAKVTVEVVDVSGKTTIFEAMFVKGSDRRGIIRVKQGSYTEKDDVVFRTEYGAEPDQGGRP